MLCVWVYYRQHVSDGSDPLPTLVVEGVSKFMSHHHSNPTKIKSSENNTQRI